MALDRGGSPCLQWPHQERMLVQGLSGCGVVRASRTLGGRAGGQAGRTSSYNASGGHGSVLGDFPSLSNIPYLCDYGSPALSTTAVTPTSWGCTSGWLACGSGGGGVALQ